MEYEVEVIETLKRQKVIEADSLNQALEKLQEEYKNCNIILDENSYKVTCNEIKINLSKIEFKLLKILLESPTRVFTKDILFEMVWDHEDSGDDNTLNVHISKIRSKLKQANPNQEYIETVWGIGYKIKG